MSAYVVVLGSVKSRLPKRCKITSLFTPLFVIWRNGDKKACYLHRFHGQTGGVHRPDWCCPHNLVPNKRFRPHKMYLRRRFVPRKRFRQDKTANTISSWIESRRENWDAPFFLDPCSSDSLWNANQPGFYVEPSSVPGQRPGTRMTINEDAAQESERRLVDSYLRLGEISHLALQRDTITKHY